MTRIELLGGTARVETSDERVLAYLRSLPLPEDAAANRYVSAQPLEVKPDRVPAFEVTEHVARECQRIALEV